MFFEANRIFNDRLVTYEDKSKFEELIQKIYVDLRLKFKYEGDFIVLHNSLIPIKVLILIIKTR